MGGLNPNQRVPVLGRAQTTPRCFVNKEICMTHVQDVKIIVFPSDVKFQPPMKCLVEL